MQFYDECVEKLPDRIDRDAVVFSVETLAAKRVYALARKYKQENPDIKVIMGGHHPTAVPDEALQYADCIVTGDAEPVWGDIIVDLKENALKPVYTSTNDYILPYSETDQSIFEGKKYSRVGIVQWKRGCLYNCDFCSVSAFYKSCVIEREIEDVIYEISEAHVNKTYNRY